MSLDLKERTVVTQRELEVLKWLAEGKTSDVISTILGISYITVNNHIANAKMKLHAVNSVHLVAKALRGGIIQ
jgi:DNA-binding CsgD family transcriptional regulator